MKKNSYIKHETSSDICYKIVTGFQSQNVFLAKVKVINMGFNQSWYLGTQVIRFSIVDFPNWKIAWKPMKCMRKAVWINLK